VVWRCVMRARSRSLIFLLGFLFVARSALADGKCAEFATNTADSQCLLLFFFPRLSVGGGWTTTLRGLNSGTGLVQFSWYLYKDTGNFEPMITSFKGGLLGDVGQNFARGIWIYPGQSEENFFSPIPEEEGVNKNGTLFAGYQANTPEALRGLAPPWVQVCNLGGMCASEVGVSPAPRWRGTFSGTADGRQGYALAIGNPGELDVIVEGDLYDSKGVKMGIQTWVIPKNGGAVAMVLSAPKTGDFSPGWGPGFGDEMFSGGQIFTGRVELRVISPGGKIVPVAFLFQNGGMSSAPMDPF